MSSKERVSRSIRHIEPDRVPIFELSINNNFSSHILNRKTDIGGGISYKNAIIANMNGIDCIRKNTAAGFKDTLELYSKLNLDIVWLKVQKYLTCVFPALGNIGALDNYNVDIREISKNRFRIDGEEGFWSECFYDEGRSNGFYNVTDCIKEKGTVELERYVRYLEKKDRKLPQQIIITIEELKKSINSTLGKKIYIAGFSDVLFPMFSSYLEIFLESMILNPILVQKYMEITTESTLILLEEQIKAGVDCIIGGNDIASHNGTIISPDHYKIFILPSLKKIVDKCHDMNIPFIKHYDGNINGILDLLIDEGNIDGLHSIEPVANMDIYALKKKYGSNITLLGNLDCANLMSFGSKEEIEKEIKKLIKNIAPGGGYVFSSSNAIHSGISNEVYEFVLNKVFEYGRYPIEIN